MKYLIAFLFLVMDSTSLTAQVYQPTWSSLDSRPIPGWFEDAKFGIFIHWGVYSVPAYRPLENGLYASYSEWYYAKVLDNEKNGGKAFHKKNYGKDFEYRDFAPLFKAELWQPDAWAKMFKDAGAQYVVLTSKHHDGFCLWPTKSPYKKNWNAMDIGPKRDLVGELTTAVRGQGLKMGLYYSIIEWESSKTHRSETGYYVPLRMVEKYKIPESEYVDKHLLPQLKELVNNYKPSLLFSDGGEWDGSEEYLKTKEFLSWLYSESPIKSEVVVNDRFAKGMPGNHGDYYSSEYSDAKITKYHPWEESRGIGGSYGFNRAENLENYSTSKHLIIELIDIVSRGGNLLLNVGPAADGTIPVIMQERLSDIGKWLKVNGEAIYGTRKSVVPAQESYGQKLYFTQKGKIIYAIFAQWPNTAMTMNLKDIGTISKVSLVGVDKQVKWSYNKDELVITLPECSINELPSFYAWAIRIETK
ncbi:alpha-L-fucosidase [Flavihumibacter profundi]|uniref:alpha-L-fucosidase n=1 Tax=Flavihumibacter profundi TaxID=2716883 RepID=UPI001CC58C87|nr:alpha-L-fucosidase [Flavihumibacter profundi]MBZ5858772.1 alpha-L-fucosidase [Flavihumibacter profundi]